MAGRIGLRVENEGARRASRELGNYSAAVKKARREVQNAARGSIQNMRSFVQAEIKRAQSIDRTSKSITNQRQALDAQVKEIRRTANAQLDRARAFEQSQRKIVNTIDQENRALREQARTERSQIGISGQQIQTIQRELQVRLAANNAIKETARARLQASKAARNEIQQIAGQGVRTLQRERDALMQVTAAKRQNAQATAMQNQRFGRFNNLLGIINPRAAGLTSQLQGVTGSMSGLSLATLAAVGAIAALAFGVFKLTKAFINAGTEGGRLIETINAFSNTLGTAPGGAGHQLNLFRQQTRGTINEVELMQLSLKALQGTTADFRDAVAPNLGTIFDATQRIARATGQSAEEIRTKFIFGLRRSENRLVDDIGVKVDAVKANEAYAESIDKTVDQLTEQQRVTAWAIEATKQLKVIADELGEPNRAIEAQARIMATLQNTWTRLQIAIEPAVAVLLEFVSGLMDGLFVAIEQVVGPIRSLGLEIQMLTDEFDDFGLGADEAVAVFRLMGKAAGLTIAAIRDVMRAFRVLGQVFSNIIQPFGAVFNSIKALSKLEIEDLAFLLGAGGGAIAGAFVGSFAKGMRLVFDVLNSVLGGMADMLMGLSPPKKGPLSRIDEGGFNAAKAWVDAFTDGLLMLDERTEVLAGVNERLGEIATLNLPQVEARLKALDIAIRPFEERLAIVKADLQEVAGFVEPALEAIERIRSRSIRALKRGGGDIEALRALDQQVTLLRNIEGVRQDMVDRAQVQLSLAQAAQAEERTLLNIQKNRLEELDKARGRGRRGRTRRGGGGADDQGEDAAQPISAGPSILDQFVPGETPMVLDDIMSGFAMGFGESGANEEVNALTTSMGETGSEAGRLGDELGKLPGKLTKPFSGLGDKMKATFNEAVQPILDAFDPEIEGSVANRIRNGLNSIFSLSDTGMLGQAISSVITFKDQQIEKFNQFWDGIWGEDGPLKSFNDKLFSLFDTSEGSGSPIRVARDAIDWLATEAQNTFQALIDFLSGDFALGAAFNESIIKPVAGMVNKVISSVEQFIIGILNGINRDVLGQDVFGVNLADVIGTIDVPQAGFLGNVAVPELATGALGHRGAAIVGDRGPELIAPRRPVDVFPARTTQAIVQMAQAMARHPSRHPLFVPGGGATNNTNNNINFAPSFNATGHPQNDRVRASHLYAMTVRR